MKIKEQKQEIILLIILVMMINILILYPVFKISLIEKNKKEIKKNVIKVISEVNNYYDDNTLFNNEYQSFTIENYNIVEEGLIINEKLPQNGKIYINKDGKIKIIASEGSYCITKEYNDNTINITDNKECNNIDSTRIGNINVVLSNDNISSGLYKNNNEYIYRGENPNNYIVLMNELYRIIKIDNNGNIEIIKNEKLNNLKWDNDNNNFSLTRETNIGYFLNNDNSIKSIRTYSNFVENEYTSYILNNSDFINPIKEIKFSSVVSLLNVNDYINASLDKTCKQNSYRNNNCGNYNWLKNNYDYYTLDKSRDSIYTISKDGKIYESESNNILAIKPVFILKSNILLKGKGTIENPYEIVTK